MSTGSSASPAVAARCESGFEAAVSRLSGYLAHPAISCEPAHHADVRALALRVRDDLAALGLERSRVLDLDGALPVVAAEWMKAGPDMPTVLVYGHLDLQPAGEPDWRTPPHVPTRIGDRLYARGAADDMGGWVSHVAAIQAWLEETGGLPCNLRLVVEGEEEIGSPNLERFMGAFPDAFEADAMILTDCENPSVDVPGLTVSLRGLFEVELVCESLDSDVHSGLWGNAVPDPVVAICQIVARLADEDGRLKYGRVDVPEAWRSAARDVPLDGDVVRRGAHLLDGVSPLPERGRTLAEWMWRQPAVTLVSTTLPGPADKKNAIRRRASAILSFRLAPGQTAPDLLAAVRPVLVADPPGGVKVSLVDRGWNGESWLYEPRGAAFEAADRAYAKAWGAPLARIGVGGTIPFVAMFARRYGDTVPLILNGVMDPETVAHGPNESLHLGVFRKAILANAFLYEELGLLGKSGIK